MKPTVENISRDHHSFTAYEFESSEFEHPYHFHHETELVFITRGFGKVLIGNTTCDFQAGDIFLIGSNVPHRFQTAHGEKQPLFSYVLQFTPDCFGSLFTETPELDRIAKMISHAKHGMVIRHAPESLFSSMTELIQAKGVSSVITFLRLLSEVNINAQLEFLSTQIEQDTEIQSTTKIHASIEWINSNYHREINLDDIAQQTHMNKNAFCRAFKAQTGTSPMSYITQVRIEAAANLLLKSAKGIADIGFSVGFPTVSSFNRNFKQIKGVSPSMYRKMTSSFTS
ncbi:helix-turn-helix domain-containing protein [Vibrio sp. WXL103]|uniref:helix-turn-helix domain-containing protein n=1 Tax=unclassified Vibrio TaxID=2614977 RepID=UPI003EC8281B